MLGDTAQSVTRLPLPFFVLVALAISLVMIATTRSRQQAPLPTPPGTPTQREQALRALGASPRVASALAEGLKINAIKAYREDNGVRLRAAKDGVDRLLIAERAALLQSAGALPRVAELLARGKKIAAIKAYREEYGAGLREAKNAVERLELFSGLTRP